MESPGKEHLLPQKHGKLTNIQLDTFQVCETLYSQITFGHFTFKVVLPSLAG